MMKIFILIFLIACSSEKYNLGESMELNYSNKNITYYANDDVWSIVDSYEIKDKKSMEDILKLINKNNDMLSERSIEDMIDEWRVHNMLYTLHLWRSHTQTVDFERDQKKILKFLYKWVSKLYWF